MGQNLEFHSRVLEWNSRFRPIASLPHCPGAAAAEDRSAATRGYLNHNSMYILREGCNSCSTDVLCRFKCVTLIVRQLRLKGYKVSSDKQCSVLMSDI